MEIRKNNRGWICRCDCGNTRWVPTFSLNQSRANRSCGCWAKEQGQLAGKRFSKLTVVQFVRKDSQGRKRWKCKCDCGKETEVTSRNLQRSATTDCGCGSFARRSAARRCPDRFRLLCNRKVENYRRTVAQRLFESELSRQEMVEMFLGKCHYCGTQGTKESPLGIDRLINAIGYAKNNTVPCCWTCNAIKGPMDEVDILAWAKTVYFRSISKTPKGGFPAYKPRQRPGSAKAR